MSDDLIQRLRDECHCNDWYLRKAAATALEAKDAEIERLRGEVYVPGSWHCAKCKFTLLQSNLNARDGTVTPRDKPGDKCPNCNSPLWRATWKQDAFEMQERAVEQMERAKAAESRAEQAERALAEAVEVLRPFAEIREALELISANKPGDVLQDERAIFQTWGLKDTPTSRQITLGHLRAARQFAKGYHAMLQAAQGGDDD